MKSFVQKHGKLLISVAVALMVAAACMGTLMQNKQTRSLVGAWMIYDGYDGGDLAPNVLVFAADGTGIGYALDSDGLDNGMENIVLPRGAAFGCTAVPLAAKRQNADDDIRRG